MLVALDIAFSSLHEVAVPALEGVAGFGEGLPTQFDLSGNGTLVYVPGSDSDQAPKGWGSRRDRWNSVELDGWCG